MRDWIWLLLLAAVVAVAEHALAGRLFPELLR
jgi:hypothetical protein